MNSRILVAALALLAASAASAAPVNPPEVTPICSAVESNGCDVVRPSARVVSTADCVSARFELKDITPARIRQTKTTRWIPPAGVSCDCPSDTVSVIERSVYPDVTWTIDPGDGSSRSGSGTLAFCSRPKGAESASCTFTLSLDDFVISYFNSGATFQTLPVTIYSMTKKPYSLKLNALSTLLFAVVLVLMLIVNIKKPEKAKKAKR